MTLRAMTVECEWFIFLFICSGILELINKINYSFLTVFPYDEFFITMHTATKDYPLWIFMLATSFSISLILYHTRLWYKWNYNGNHINNVYSSKGCLRKWDFLLKHTGLLLRATCPSMTNWQHGLGAHENERRKHQVRWIGRSWIGQPLSLYPLPILMYFYWYIYEES